MSKRGKFSLSNYKLFSADMGELVPCGLTEVLPGDTIQQATTCMVRFAPLLSPVMHPTHVQISHWFVPHRLVWDEWEDFITGGPDGLNASEFPTIKSPASTGYAIGSLSDYLGVPTGVADLYHSALPHRGYALIWNEWFRDQDLQTKLVIDETSGVDTTTSVALQNGGWEKDYFTTARPYEQKGPSITIPLGSSAPVHGIFGPLAATYAAPGTPGNFLETGGADATGKLIQSTPTGWALEGNNTTKVPNVRADLTGASAVTVNLLREAMALQRFEEARARFGSRYVEYLRYLGVQSSDARLQRPEYLGGGRYPIQYSEVVQTAPGTDPVGALKGHGIGVARSNRYRRYFEEHGYVFTFMTIKPKTIYVQGLPRTWNRRTKEDFFQKELQHIGQQEILYKEVKASHATPDGTFGWQDRYDEYRRTESTIAGEFRDTLKFWHFARFFATDPALNADFVKCVPNENPFAVPSADVIQVMARHSMQARRIVAQTGSSYIL